MRHLVPLALAALLAGGCGGFQHPYAGVTPEVGYPVKGRVAVAVHDQRAEVVNGSRPESFAGLLRGGYGNPFDVTTASGQPLAKEFQSSLADALTRAGAQVVRVDLAPATKPDAARQQVLAAGADKALLVTLRMWRADTYVNVNLDHDVLLVVLGRRGQVLATKELKGAERIGTSLVNPGGESVEVVPPAYRRKLEALFADPAVAAALR